MKSDVLRRIIWKLKYKKLSLISSYCYGKGIVKLPYPPIEVFIEPTNYCNLKCIICPHGSGIKREKGFMPFSLFKLIISDVADSRILRATVNFAGEPLLNKNIFDMIRLLKGRNIYTRMHTNATLLGEDYSRRLIESGLDELSFSFDDHRKEVYEKVRVDASFEITLSNIKRFLAAKKKIGAEKPYVIIQRMRLNSDYNDDEEGYKKLFCGLPVDKFKSIITHNWAGNCEGPLIAKYNLAKSPCKAIWTRIAIGWDGKVYACCNEMNGKLLVGDLNFGSILDAWNSPAMIDLRKKMLQHSYNKIEACRGCDVLLRSDARMGFLKRNLAGSILFLEKLKV